MKISYERLFQSSLSICKSLLHLPTPLQPISMLRHSFRGLPSPDQAPRLGETWIDSSDTSPAASFTWNFTFLTRFPRPYSAPLSPSVVDCAAFFALLLARLTAACACCSALVKHPRFGFSLTGEGIGVFHTVGVYRGGISCSYYWWSGICCCWIRLQGILYIWIWRCWFSRWSFISAIVNLYCVELWARLQQYIWQYSTISGSWTCKIGGYARLALTSKNQCLWNSLSKSLV